MDCLNSTINLADTLCPTDPIQHFFTEIIICDDLIVPTPKPDMELITKVTQNFVVNDVEEITVDLGDRAITSLLRKKIAITGIIKLGIEYSADVPEQEVHFMHFDIPFQGIIGYRPCETAPPGGDLGNYNRGLIDPLLYPLFDIDDYYVHVCLEHEQYHQLSPRVTKAVLVLLIWLEKKPTPPTP